MEKEKIHTRTQTINGVVYVYEDHPFWNSEKQQTRHKRVYIGKKDNNGVFIPNASYLKRFSSTGAHVTGGEPGLVQRRFAGVSHLLDEISSLSMISADLQACFPKDHRAILSLAYYLVSESEAPMYRFGHWARNHTHPFDAELTSQRISEVFSRISYDGVMRFFARQRARYGDKEHLVYDITSISSYSELLRQFRYGNNKGGEPLPQLNLALVFGQTSMMPVYYRTLPGNVTDVTTLRKLLRDLQLMDIGKTRLVLDRGFYSARNVDSLYQNRCKFVMGSRRNTRFAQSHIEENRKQLTDFSSYDAELGLHVATASYMWPYKEYDSQGRPTDEGHRRIYVHMYHNSAQAEADKTSFFAQLSQTTQALINGGCSPQQQAMADEFLNVHTTPVRGMSITPNEEAIRAHTAEFGYFVLLSNEIKDPRQALWIYRNKDVVEKAFSNLKNRLSMRRPHVQSEESLEGKLFVQFVALMLVSYILKQMKAHGLYKNWTLQEVLDELDGVEQFDQNGKRPHYGEVTGKQRKLFEYLGIKPPGML